MKIKHIYINVDKELNQLSFGLDLSYIDKNKHVKRTSLQILYLYPKP